MKLTLEARRRLLLRIAAAEGGSVVSWHRRMRGTSMADLEAFAVHVEDASRVRAAEAQATQKMVRVSFERRGKMMRMVDAVFL